MLVVGEITRNDEGEILASSGFYIDDTETLSNVAKKTADELVGEISNSRAAIEQAKGMLMFVYGIPANRAFDILVWRSQEANVKVRDVAERLIRVVDNFHVPTTLRTRFGRLLLRM